jgi:hypothetical protein
MVNTVGTPAHVLALPKWVLAIHAVQAVFAIIILGLDAYGIHYIAYNALIYSLVVVSPCIPSPSSFLSDHHSASARS